MNNTQVIQPDLTLTNEGFRRGVQIAIEPQGTIGAVGGNLDAQARKLPGRALLPGMINAHSHSFQRALRGHGEVFGSGAGSFWTWRQLMYDLVERMDERSLYEISARAYREMLSAGITTVGEFHYLHHNHSGRSFALDEVVLRAAADTGIRLVLLSVLYRAGGLGQPLSGPQKRFGSDSLDEYWNQLAHLKSIADPTIQSVGVAAHSIRAVAINELQALHEEATRRGLIFHMHLEEQPGEIEACLSRHGKRPMALICGALCLDAGFTAVHCTHTAKEEMETFLAAGANVCVCPLTEANLGDGIPDLGLILERGGTICVGTDSNARISFTEEMRWLEYAQRLTRQRRGVCVDTRGSCAGKLWETATINGARALGLRAGAIQPGHVADLVVVDIEAESLAGATEQTLLDAFIFGSGREAITDVCVGGKWLEVAEGVGVRGDLTEP